MIGEHLSAPTPPVEEVSSMRSMTRRDLLSLAALGAALALVACSPGNGRVVQTSETAATSGVSAGETSEPSLTPVEDPWAAMVISGIPELRALSKYEEEFGGRAPDALMYFTSIPNSEADAEAQAVGDAVTYKAFRRAGVAPIVIMEPSIKFGGAHEASKYYAGLAKGSHSKALDSYYSGLKKAGVTDEMLGVVVHMPETNAPAFGTTVGAEQWAQCVVAIAAVQKQHFPDSHASVMLDASPYPAGSSGWDGEQVADPHAAIVSYAAQLKTQMQQTGVHIDSFGLQGFPWLPQGAGSEEKAALDANQYLSVSTAAAAADAMGVKNVWLNTGTMANLTTKKRTDLLTQVVNQVRTAKTQGYQVAVSIFAEDKSHTPEHVDWSYTGKSKVVLKGALNLLRASGIRVGFFDSASKT